ncbi:hypothetical protein JBL43_09205 [Aureibaculum sp. A20]|uniref:Lipoprotein n=1 Tax=Aureibaculum flavum TaxID=2795986 RepID=A0ABS0WR05_9FLAO|nr:hypothetical protein [Aureibaculum flavum]MBJ2174413.1 hypothetical protein [Aureibaculum flavum]
MKMILSIFFSISIFLCACTSKEEPINNENDELAAIVSVVSSGTESAFSFSVGISSPDTGCNQYADWWEVIAEDGTLLYRRILDHSHVNEQPFVRSGGTINITSTQNVIIRAHMNTSGYGVLAFTGSVDAGFKAITLDEDFLQNLANEAPLPTGCAF